MRTEGKHLCRDCDSLFLGVCSGIAGYFGVSRSLVRALAILLVPITFGAVLPLYLLFAILLPKSIYSCPDCVDVSPIRTDGRKRLPSEERPCDPRARLDQLVSDMGALGAVAQGGTGKMPGSAYFATYGSAEDFQVSKPHRITAYTIVLLAIAVLAGALMVLSRLFPQVSWFGCWPVFITAFGIVLMVGTPAHPWSAVRFLVGLLMVLVSCIILCCSIGVVGWGVWYAIASYWPLLLVAAGLGLLGFARDVPGFDAVSVVLLLIMVATGGCRFLIGQPPGPASDLAGQSQDLSSSAPLAKAVPDGQAAKSLSLAGYDSASFRYNGGYASLRLGPESAGGVTLSATKTLAERSALNMACGNRHAYVTVDGGSSIGAVADTGTIYTGLAQDMRWKDVTLVTSFSDDEIDLSRLDVAKVAVVASNSHIVLCLGGVKGGEDRSVKVDVDGSTIMLRLTDDAPLVVHVADGVAMRDKGALHWDDEIGGWANAGYQDARDKGRPCWSVTLQGADSQLELEQGVR